MSGDRATTWQLPTVTATVNRKERTKIDGAGLRAIIAGLHAMGVDMFIIERVNGIARQSASASFNFGYTCGRIAEMCEATGARVETVPPQTWRGQLGVFGLARKTGMDKKDASRAVASQLWPADAHQWSKKTWDGPAEAALIAEYGRRFFGA